MREGHQGYGKSSRYEHKKGRNGFKAPHVYATRKGREHLIAIIVEKRKQLPSGVGITSLRAISRIATVGPLGLAQTKHHEDPRNLA